MLRKYWRITVAYFLRPLRLFRTYETSNFRSDLIAGLTVGVIALPQAIAYAMIAELPPYFGLYAAVVSSIIGALWGSSNHLNTGPTNTTSLLVLATLLPVAEVGSDNFLVAAGLMAVMVGVFKLVLGIARLGVLVNFVSDSVVIGFTAGAGVLIGANQLRHFLSISFPSSASLLNTINGLATHITETHLPSFAFGLGILLIIIFLKRFAPKMPGALLGLVFATIAVIVFHLDNLGIKIIGEIPRSLPPFVKLPILDLELIGQLSSGALAVGAISLVEATSISRTVATKSGQYLNSNQEFIGQGLANIVSGFFSGYAVSGSFSRTVVDYEAGGKTSLASVISGIFILFSILLIAPLAAFLPRTALASVLLITAYGMVDRKEIIRIWRGARGDAVIMVITFLATLLLPLQFAVLIGILISFAFYILVTSVPRIVPVLPTKDFDHFVPVNNQPICSQLGILDIFGDLYFGASSHIEEAIHEHLEANPSHRYLLLRMLSVNQIDISGVHALESIVRSIREEGGDVFMMRTQAPVLEVFKATGFYDYLGEDHFLAYGNEIEYLFYRVLDPVICIYECEARVFKECLNLPRPINEKVEGIAPLGDLVEDVESVEARDLWEELHQRTTPIVVDIREPREYKRGHIPQAISIPIFKLLDDPSRLHQIRPVVLVCRSGRRSARAIKYLKQKGFRNIRILKGGIVAWEKAGFLEAVER